MYSDIANAVSSLALGMLIGWIAYSFCMFLWHWANRTPKASRKGFLPTVQEVFKRMEFKLPNPFDEANDWGDILILSIIYTVTVPFAGLMLLLALAGLGFLWPLGVLGAAAWLLRLHLDLKKMKAGESLPDD